MKKSILILLSLFFVSSAFSDNCSLSDRKLAVFFSNGMSNDKRDAKDSLAELIDKTQPTELRKEVSNVNSKRGCPTCGNTQISDSNNCPFCSYTSQCICGIYKKRCPQFKEKN